MQAPETQSLATNEIPFWAAPLEERPAFMQVVIPYQNEEWNALKKIAQKWTIDEPQSPDAWYYLGVAEEGKGQLAEAKTHLSKAVSLNARELDAMNALARVAFVQKDSQSLAALEAPVRLLDEDDANIIVEQLKQLDQSK